MYIDDQKIVNLYELGDPRAPKWLGFPGTWPGHHSTFLGKKFNPPYGPAQGTEDPQKGGHAYWWDNGHFFYFPWCVKTNLESVPEPGSFEVSNWKDGQAIDNALYLTWTDPQSGPEDGFVLMRKSYYGNGGAYDTTGYECVAQLGPTVHEYTDTCLDGGTGWWYKLETYRYHQDPLYRGCSLPTACVEDGWVTGDPCPGSLVPTSPRLLSCDNCVLRWEDRSNNEAGFHIWFNGEIVGSGGTNATSYNVSNCNTGKLGYRVSAFNAYGESSSQGSTLPCNGGESGCPFIYVWNGEGYVKDNNLLSASQDTALSKSSIRDFYLLTHPLIPQANHYKLQIREFEREYSSLDYVKLIALDYPPNKKIGLTPQGNIYAYHNPRLPLSCVDNNGFDCLAEITYEDSLYYANDHAGYMIINFGVLADSLAGQFKALTDGGGGGAPEPPKDDPIFNKLTPFANDLNSNILTVEVLEDSSWTPVAKLYPRSKPGIRLIELKSFIKSQKELKMKLSWERGYSANQIAFYDFESISLLKQNLQLSTALNLSFGDIKDKLIEPDNIYAELKPGETFEVTFPYLPTDSNMQRDFIIVAQGYYYTKDTTEQYPTLESGDTSSALQQNYPNPFNPETAIKFVLTEPSRVKLVVYNLLGQKVVTLIDKEMPAGSNTIIWDGKNELGEEVSSGVYFYRLEAGELQETKKMMIVR